jgi:hypothetical protein
MPEKFPEKLPPKGEGRVDNKHRVALLTEPEIGALNFLKNMDRAMGYKSGFSPMMQNLAAQNTRPLEYVEYRGERIPSLNDFSEGGYGGGGDRGSDAGEREARDQTSSGGDRTWANTQRILAETQRKKMEERDNWLNEQIRKQNERREQRRQQLGQRGYRDSEHEADEEQDRLSELGYGGRGSDPGSYGGGQQRGGRGEGEQNYGPGGEPYVPDYEDDGDGDNPYGLRKEYQAHDGSMHWSQESADAENALLLDELRASKERELYDYGGTASEAAYTDLGSDFETYLDDTLAGQRQTAYDQVLAGLYEDQKQSGVWDQDTYDTALAGVDAEVLADTGRLDEYGEQLKTSAKGDYDAWLEDQMSDISGQGYQDLKDWNWSDLDLSSHTDNQEYQDFNFLDEFKKLDPEGNVVGTDTGAGTGEEVDSAGVEATPASRTAIKKKKKYTPISSSASLTGGGSSSNIS